MDNNEKEVLVEVKNLEVTFTNGKNKFVAVHDANFQVCRGETFSLVGESGSGKTTIARAINRINPISNGEVLFEGKRISGKISRELDKEVIRKIQMVFQDPAASLNERATVDYIVSEGLVNFKLYKDEADRYNQVVSALNEVGLLEEHMSRYPHEFSGGQRQRIGIARAIIMKPDLLIADEPISALDVSIRAQVLNLLKRLQRERGLTCIFIAHDLSVVRFISDRIAVIHLGRIVELAETNELFLNPLHPYTQSLLGAVPIPDPQIEKAKVVKPYSLDSHHYDEDKPAFHEIKPGHFVWANEAELAEYRKNMK